MFYQVQIYDRDGNIKKIISAEELRRIHWEKIGINKKQYLAPKKGTFKSMGFPGQSRGKFKLRGSW